jgi:Cep192 domain 4
MRARKNLQQAVGTILVLAAAVLSAHAQAADSQRVIEITPAKLEFGNQAVNTASQPQPVTVRNLGQSAVSIQYIIASGIDFSQTNNCGTGLAPAAECTVQVTFRPATTGPRLGTLSIFDSDPTSPQMVVVNGTGE